MTGVESRDFDSPDETRTPDKTRVDVVRIGATTEAYVIEPGHDAWVVGEERFVAFEFESRSAEEYAKG